MAPLYLPRNDNNSLSVSFVSSKTGSFTWVFLLSCTNTPVSSVNRQKLYKKHWQVGNAVIMFIFTVTADRQQK